MWSPFQSLSSSPSSSSSTSSLKPIVSSVYVNNNEKLKGLINTVLIHLPTLSSDEKLLLEKEHDSELISYQTISILSKYLKSKYEYSVYAGNRKVHDKIINYLDGSKLVFPSLMKKESEPSPELIQRRQYLLARQEGREYNKMMYGTYTDPNVQKVLSQGNHMESLKEQLSVSANMIVSVFAMFGISYYIGTQYSKNQTTWMIFGIVGATIIMIVEMAIYIIRAIKLEAVYESSEARSERREALAQIRSGSLLTARSTKFEETKSKSIFHKAFKPANDDDNFDSYLQSLNGDTFSQTIEDDDDEDDESLELLHPKESKKDK